MRDSQFGKALEALEHFRDEGTRNVGAAFKCLMAEPEMAAQDPRLGGRREEGRLPSPPVLSVSDAGERPRGATKQNLLTALPRRTKRTRVNWQASDDLTVDEWKAAGPTLGIESRASGWWIGDWVRFGARHYSLSIADAAAITGYEEQTLYNMVSIAARFPVSRRREKLSWSHHADVAALPEPEQETWLNRAVAEHLSVQELRKDLQRARRAGRASDTEKGRVPRKAARAQRIRMTCPHCDAIFEIDRDSLDLADSGSGLTETAGED